MYDHFLACVDFADPCLLQLIRDEDPEVVYRSLIAIGNLVRPPSPRSISEINSFVLQLLSPHVTASMPAAGLERYRTLAMAAKRFTAEARIKAVLVEIARK